MATELQSKVPTLSINPVTQQWFGSIGHIFGGIKVRELVDKIEEYRNYGANWGGFGEHKVDSRACDRAEIFLVRLAFSHPQITGLHVYPTTAGNVGVEWRSGQDDYAAIFSNDGAELTRDNDDPSRCLELPLGGDIDVLRELNMLG